MLFTTHKSIIACFAKVLILESENDVPDNSLIAKLNFIDDTLKVQQSVVASPDGVLEFESKQALQNWLLEFVTEIPNYDSSIINLINGVVVLLMIEWNTINNELWFRK